MAGARLVFDMLTDILLFFHLLGLMLGAGGGFGSTVTMQTAAKLPPEQASVLRSLGPSLSRLSSIGLVLMLVTGLLLVFLKYGGFGAMPTLFWVKIVFVTTLTIAATLIELSYAAVKRGDGNAGARLQRLEPMAGVSSLLATLFAVLAFH